MNYCTEPCFHNLENIRNFASNPLPIIVNITSLNNRLRFSWSHIIAFIAMIAVSYFTFMGAVYHTGGNFIAAAVGLAVVDFMLILVFIGAQQLKASGTKMRRKILWERLLIFSSPIIFAAATVFCQYFWDIRTRQHDILSEFNSALNDAGEMFNEYDSYADDRIEQYESRLDSIQSMHSNDPYVYGKLGFTAGEEQYQRENMLLTLRTQLFGKRYKTLRDAAYGWIRDARRGASVWNVFIVGNIDVIRHTIRIWDEQLNEFSADRMSNECIISEFRSESAQSAIDRISRVEKSLSCSSIRPSPAGIAICLVLYIMLLLPYMIQRRDGKSVYSLIHGARRHDGWLKNGSETGDTNDDNNFTTF